MTSDAKPQDGDVAARARQLLLECGIDPAGMSDAEATARARVIAEWGAKFTSSIGERYSEIFDGHIRNIFTQQSVEQMMAEVGGDQPCIIMAPSGTGGVGREQVEEYYRSEVLGTWPQDLELTPVSRTVGERQVVEEVVLDFTHDVEMPSIFPGVAPTGRRVSLAFVIIMAFDPATGKITHQHVHWDQASALVQLGLMDPEGLPVYGVEQSRKLLDKNALPSNLLMRRPPAAGR